MPKCIHEDLQPQTQRLSEKHQVLQDLCRTPVNMMMAEVLEKPKLCPPQTLRDQFPDSVDNNSQLTNNVSGLYMKLMKKPAGHAEN